MVLWPCRNKCKSDGKWRKKYQLFSLFNPVPSLVNKIFFFSLLYSFYISVSLSLHICMWIYMYVHVCMPACMYIFKTLAAIFSAHCTVVPLTYSTSQKGRRAVNAKLAPDPARESAKAYLRMASSNNTNSSFSCSLFIGLDRQQEPDTLFYS